MDIRDRLDQLLSSEDLSPDEYQGLRASLSRDPGLAGTLEAWARVRVHVREHIDSAASDRRLFVLCSLASAGHALELSEEERAEVEAFQSQYDRSIQQYAGLAEAARGVDRDRAVFMATWAEASHPVRRLGPRVWRMAAVIAVVGLLGALALILRQQDANWHTMSASAGDTGRIELPDGSVMHLVGPAEVRYPEGSFSRHLELTGSAFMDVIRDDALFTVSTPEAVISVLGTRFGVQAAGGVTEVVLESGRVVVASQIDPRENQELRPGEMSRVVAGEPPTKPVSTEIAQALGWTGFMFFRGTPLGEAVEILSTRYGVQVNVHPDLAKEPVTGSFSPEESLEHILNALAITLDAVAVEENGAWRVTP